MRTVEADGGEATPVAAANAYLLAVFNGSDDELGIRRCLCDDHETELLAEARAWRAKVAAANSEIKVESSDWKTPDADGTVSATIASRFTLTDQAPAALPLSGAVSMNGAFAQSKSGASAADGKFAASTPRRFVDPSYVASCAAAHPFQREWIYHLRGN